MLDPPMAGLVRTPRTGERSRGAPEPGYGADYSFFAGTGTAGRDHVLGRRGENSP